MITFILTISSGFFFLLSTLLFAVYAKLLSENTELKKKILEFEENQNISNKININSTGFYKHFYYDESLKMNAALYIHFKVSNKDVSGGNFKFDFDFDRFHRENIRKNTNIGFDFQTIKFLRLKEHQWHNIKSEEIIWAEFEEEVFTIDDFKFQEPIESFELSEYEKKDINSFLKFSTISEETKDSIRKILKI